MPGISRALATFALMLVGLGLAAVIAVQWVIRPAAAANSYLLSQTDGTQPEYGLPTGVGAAQGPALRPPHSQVAVAVATPTCGPQWVAANTPNVGAGDNALTGVSVISSSEAWAVGFYTDTTTGIAQTLVEKFNGSTWSIIPSPNMGPGDNYLQAVAARTSSDIWAVGYYR